MTDPAALTAPPTLEQSFTCLEELRAVLDWLEVPEDDPRRRKLETAYRRGRSRSHLILTDASGRRIASIGFNARLEPHSVYCKPIHHEGNDRDARGYTKLESALLEALESARKTNGFAEYGRPSTALDSPLKIALNEGGTRLGESVHAAVLELERRGILERRVHPQSQRWWLRRTPEDPR